jgi:inhibitor of KinA sporulation pathway (predicted exonuclease)
MNYIILDLEATCWQGNIMDRNQEIIELAAYRVDGYSEWLDHFQSFVKPVEHPRLSAYCTDLTGITQEQISKAKSFDRVFPMFEDWYLKQDGPQLICTWGSKDMDMIYAECSKHDIDASFLPAWINLKTQYASIQRLQKEVGLLKALEHLEIPFEGSHHRALDDAFNTTKLFLRFLDRWQY